MSALVHVERNGQRQWAVRRDEQLFALDLSLAELLSMPLDAARERYQGASVEIPDDGRSLPPVDRQEVWAAGVTYLRSRQGRAEESGHADVYDLVYQSDRPELFLKATPGRVVTEGDAVGIRADSGWDVPEAELGLVLNSSGEVFGYLPGNDMSSRSIEGDNPLYLPQAKVYTASCALGSQIVPAWEAGDGPFGIGLRVERDGDVAFTGKTSTELMRRRLPELAGWLFRALEHPAGAVLLTGTGIVPDATFTLHEHDVVSIEITGVGSLTNPVVVVGEA